MASSKTTDNGNDEPVYKFLVLDSGPIIKLTSISTLWKRAQHFYTVPAVLDEIRDAKARQHLQQLPMPLETRLPSSQSIHAVSEFSKQTGDYQSLSTTDIHVMALVYELEREASGGNMQHIRTTPKRVVGLGPLKNLGNGNRGAAVADGGVGGDALEEADEEEVGDEEDDDEAASDSDSDSDDGSDNADENNTLSNISTGANCWAKVVSPTASFPISTSSDSGDAPLHVSFGKMLLGNVEDDDGANQFSDAEDDPIYNQTEMAAERGGAAGETTIEQELDLEFPSLAAAATVPIEDEDHTDTDEVQDDSALLEQQLLLEEERKKEALKPRSKSGKFYNSFKKYGDLMKPKLASKPKDETEMHLMTDQLAPTANGISIDTIPEGYEKSRIVGGLAFSGQDDYVEDDGEGWISTSAEISTMKASGVLDPMRSGSSKDDATTKQLRGPPPSERAACATTDFAMQNVLLQMNMELLSVDGMKVRKLKSWVTRCGSCYKIFTSTDNLGPLKSKRLFCSHCGSDFLQRIACSVDGKTGRLKLHFSKRYKNNLRGTKFSLPKPSSGNRFQGDLLLREDQLLTGAWNQKVKMLSGGKTRDAAQSIFGKDIATNVGCKASAVGGDEIRVGFGRRNPNAAKGRERRGKRKKTTEKACGLRRY